jgi:RsiW-degrading membrane proteinase PrsW (M82 family)
MPTIANLTFTNIAFLVALGLLPSLIWLFYYLKHDLHPEPKRLIVKTFLMGVLFAPVVALLQWLFVEIASNFYDIYKPGASFFLWAAAVEETIKLLAVRVAVLKHAEFDEPTDAMIYMVTAALGFAAIENVLVLMNIIPNGTSYAVGVLALRFIGATFLHALAAAITGYFLAISWFFRRHALKLILLGLTLATSVHFLFNMLLQIFQDNLTALIYSTALLLSVAYVVARLFIKTRQRDPEFI